jgi:hypothetical protein
MSKYSLLVATYDFPGKYANPPAQKYSQWAWDKIKKIVAYARDPKYDTPSYFLD